MCQASVILMKMEIGMCQKDYQSVLEHITTEGIQYVFNTSKQSRTCTLCTIHNVITFDKQKDFQLKM